MRPTLTLKRSTHAAPSPSAAESSDKPAIHPLARYHGQHVVVQLRGSGVRYQGRFTGISHSLLTLEGAIVHGTRHTAVPSDGVVVLSIGQIGHVHCQDAVVTSKEDRGDVA